MSLLRLFELILPALIPSWNFFDVIVPSPRVQVCLRATGNDPDVWEEVRPRPPSVSGNRMLRRMFWNARWNEQLYMVSLAERLVVYPTRHSHQQMLQRIQQELVEQKSLTGKKGLKFRLVFIRREGNRLIEEVGYESDIIQLEASL